MKHLIAISLTSVFLLSACGGGEGGTNQAANPGLLTAGNQTIEIDRLEPYFLDIVSSQNRVTVGQGNTLTTLRVGGIDNAVVIKPNAVVQSFDVTGANNILSLLNNVRVASLRVVGANDALTVAANARVDLLAIEGSNVTVNIADPSAAVLKLKLSGSNIAVSVPTGYRSKVVITDTGAGNTVVER